MRLKEGTPKRNVTEIGPGDYIKTGVGNFEKVDSNSAFNAQSLPRKWAVVTQNGRTYDMHHINGYYKSGDFEGEEPQSSLLVEIWVVDDQNDPLYRVWFPTQSKSLHRPEVKYLRENTLFDLEYLNTASLILQRAANEPCHRSDYGWPGTCLDDNGGDNYHKCAACLARDFLGLTPRQ